MASLVVLLSCISQFLCNPSWDLVMWFTNEVVHRWCSCFFSIRYSFLWNKNPAVWFISRFYVSDTSRWFVLQIWLNIEIPHESSRRPKFWMNKFFSQMLTRVKQNSSPNSCKKVWRSEVFSQKLNSIPSSNKPISFMLNTKLFSLVAFPWDKIEQYSKYQ